MTAYFRPHVGPANGVHFQRSSPPLPFTTVFPTPETPVLIVGGGPIGIFSAILLAKYGIRSTVVERHGNGLRMPRAHATNLRSLEILRQAGLDVDRLRSLGATPEDADMVRFATSMVGCEFGNIPLGYQTADTKEITPEPLFNIPQTLLEDYFYEVALQTGAITLWRDVEWQSSLSTADGFEESSILNRLTKTVTHIRSKYLLCCDGANARSQSKLDISSSVIDGHQLETNYITVYFQADLRKMKSGTLFFILSPSRIGTFICYNRDSTWAYVMIYDPAVTPASTFTEEYCRAAIEEGLGEKVPFKIVTTTAWKTFPKVADTYRSGTHPTAFVLGDAAHSFPPTGGLGINTGIADAHNLAWKIYANEKKWSFDGHRFLDSYEQDRRPVALANSRQSYLNQQKLAKLFGTILGGGTQDLASKMSDAHSSKEIEEAILDNWVQFNAINLHIGYIYGASEGPSRDLGKFVAECTPGGRLPHGWIQMSGATYSTLDLIDSHTFALLGTAGFIPEQKSPIHMFESSVPVKILRLGIDFNDPDGKWSDSMGMTGGECGVLVRPDQHIISKVNSLEELELALKGYLFW